MNIIAIDPGTLESAYVILEKGKITAHFKRPNHHIESALGNLAKNYQLIIEEVQSYGMPVGKDVFETVYWSGRFAKAYDDVCNMGMCAIRLPRRDVKLHLCGMARAKDSNIITALIDRFDPHRRYGKYGKGTKKKPGPLWGFSSDEWQALALAVTYYDKISSAG